MAAWFGLKGIFSRNSALKILFDVQLESEARPEKDFYDDAFKLSCSSFLNRDTATESG